MTSIRRLPLATTVLAALAAGGCATLETRADFDREVGFSELRSFTWIEPSADQRATLEAVSPFLERRLQRAVESELLDRGFVRGSGEEVDFLVTGHVVSLAEGDGDRRYRRGRGSVSFGVTFGGPYYGYWGPYRPYRGWYGYPSYYGYGGGYYGYPYLGYSYGWPYFGIAHYPAGHRAPDSTTPGTLVVEIFEVESHRLVWRGWTEGAFSYAVEPDELAVFVDETVHDIMLRFPPES
jgi:hypothetical protein